MTKKNTLSRYPRFPASLPSSISARIRSTYTALLTNMVAAGKDGSPSSEVAAIAAMIANAVEHDTPKATRTLKDQIWQALREWNLACSRAEASATNFGCARCGEYRPNEIEAEGTIVRHATLVKIEGTNAIIKPTGCQHARFIVKCLACECEHEGYVPMVDADPIDGGEKGHKDFSVN